MTEWRFQVNQSGSFDKKTKKLCKRALSTNFLEEYSKVPHRNNTLALLHDISVTGTFLLIIFEVEKGPFEPDIGKLTSIVGTCLQKYKELYSISLIYIGEYKPR